MEKQIILYSSSESAKHVAGLEGWMDRKGRFGVRMNI